MTSNNEFLSILSAYPFATASSAVFYAVCGAMLLAPGFSAFVKSRFSHPITPSTTFLRGFDTLRGLAASYVAIGHCWYFTYPLFQSTQLTFRIIAFNSKAVPMFVMLSGFLLCRSALQIKTLEDIRTYVRRRFFRIYPVYLTSVILCVLFGQLVPTFKGVGTAGFLTSELMMFRSLGFPIFGNPATWSLYVEVQFYVLLPIFVIFVTRDRLMLASLLLLGALLIADQQPIREFYLWKYFFFGILASECSTRYATILSGWIGKLILVASIVLLALDLLGPEFDWAYRLGLFQKNEAEMTVGLGVAFSLFIATLPHARHLGALLDVFFLRFIGVVSYSIFIIHPFYILVSFPEVQFRSLGTLIDHFKSLPGMPTWYLPLVFAPGILTWAGLSFLLIERPALMLAKRRKRAVPIPEATPVLVGGE